MRKDYPEKLVEAVVKLLMERRSSLGLSHEKLAEAAGLHRSAIGHIEKGIRKPSLLVCAKLAEAMSLSLSETVLKAENMIKSDH